ncbi:MAG: glycoside hydrolase family 2 protein [Flavobacteriaceae bacterium]|nr:glycoside hydrolase family 2 protein [Flavobacteriaceae bacterium]
MMKLTSLFYFLFILFFISCNESKTDIERQNLSKNWKFLQEGDSLWMPASIPGTVQTDLLNLKKIPQPFKANNEDSIQWVSERNWFYKTHFLVAKDALLKSKHFLNFEGLDTYASIFLNDSLILNTNNAFRNWEMEVSDILQLKNVLQIKLQATDSIEKTAIKKLDYELPEAPRVFTRKPQFQYGWDWGPTIKTMGITKNISLVSYENIWFKEVFLKTNFISDSIANISAELTIHSQKQQEISIKIINHNNKETFISKIEISPKQTEYTIPFNVKNPKLWWTYNLGIPFLYDIDVELLNDGYKKESFSKKLGIRSIKLISEKDSIGEGFYFKLNGKPVYMKGANYIPQNIFLPKVDQEDYSNLINDVVDANMNMLRVWGGGVYEAEFFYQLCDVKGVLVWQDFMFACAMYPGDEAFLVNIKQEAIENVKRLRQHPSIALWCGNNENSEGWYRWGWKDGKTEAQKQEIWEGYYAVFNHILPRVVDSLHPSVSYWESSPKFGRGDYRYQFEGDAHDWWVWHDGYPFEHFEEKVPRFMSEFGFQSFPSYEAIKYFTELDTINLSDPSFTNHQKHARGFSLIREYMERDFPVPLKGEDYVYMSQVLQAYGITKGIYAHRRSKPYNMGTLYWQLNDCWPAVSWSSIDGLGNWKALHYQAKKAFENVIISTSKNEKEIDIYIVNDTFSEIKDTLVISHLDFNGTVIFKKEALVSSPINSSTIVYKYQLNKKEFDHNNTFLKITFGESEYLHYFAKPKNLNLINEPIAIKIIKNKDGFLMKLNSEILQKEVFLFSKEKGTWQNNFFDLLPGVSKEIQFKTDAEIVPIVNFKTLNQFIQH